MRVSHEGNIKKMMSLYLKPESLRPISTKHKMSESNTPKQLIYQIANNNSNSTNRKKSVSNRGLAMEKEKLYEDCINLKANLNNLTKDLIYTKAEITKKDNELKRQSKVITELMADTQTNFLNSADLNGKILGKIKENNLIQNFKFQYKDMKKKLIEKENEFENFKRFTRVTKINEVVSENKLLIEEMEKMKNGYENALRQGVMYEELLKEFVIIQENLFRQEKYIYSLQEEIKNLQNAPNLAHKKTLKDSQMNFFTTNNKDSDLKSKRIRELEKENNLLKSGKNNQILIKYEKEIKQLNEKVQSLEIKLALNEININSNQNKQNSNLNYDSVFNTNNSLDTKHLNQNLNPSSLNTSRLSANWNEENIKEFNYILIKNFEARELDCNRIKESILIDSNTHEDIANKFISILRIKNINDKSKLLQYCRCLYRINNENIEEMKSKLEFYFNDLEIDKTKKDLNFKNKVRNAIKDYRENIISSVRNLDKNNTNLIQIPEMKKILSNLDVKLQYGDYLILKIKKYTIKQGDSCLDDLNYEKLIKFFKKEEFLDNSLKIKQFNDNDETKNLDNLLNDTKNEKIINLDDLSNQEQESKNEQLISKSNIKEDDDDEVVLTMNEFNKKVDQILSKLAEILIANKKTVRQLFKEVVFIHSISDEEKNEAIQLVDFISIIKKLKIQLDSVDIYCIFTKLKYSDEFENIDVIKLIEEMLNYGIFEENFNINNDNALNQNNNSDDFSVDLDKIEDMDIEGLGD